LKLEGKNKMRRIEIKNEMSFHRSIIKESAAVIRQLKRLL